MLPFFGSIVRFKVGNVQMFGGPNMVCLHPIKFTFLFLFRTIHLTFYYQNGLRAGLTVLFETEKACL